MESVIHNELERFQEPSLTIMKLNEVIQVIDSVQALTYHPVLSLHYPHIIYTVQSV